MPHAAGGGWTDRGAGFKESEAVVAAKGEAYITCIELPFMICTCGMTTFL